MLLTLLLSITPLALAHPPHWVPPSASDVRGPCPGLNSLANHNLIPHSGRNLTIPLLVAALNATFNISPEFGTITASAGLSTAPDPSVGSFNLDHLNKHNAIEHDASLSRADFAFVGKEGVARFDYATFKRWFGHFRGQEFIDIPTAARARYAQVEFSRERNPDFTYGESQRIGGYAEQVLYLKTMADKLGRTRKEFVRILFEEERLPFDEGWQRPGEQLNTLTLADNVLRLALATPEKTVYFGEDGAHGRLHWTDREKNGDMTFKVQGPTN